MLAVSFDFLPEIYSLPDIFLYFCKNADSPALLRRNMPKIPARLYKFSLPKYCGARHPKSAFGYRKKALAIFRNILYNREKNAPVSFF